MENVTLEKRLFLLMDRLLFLSPHSPLGSHKKVVTVTETYFNFCPALLQCFSNWYKDHYEALTHLVSMSQFPLMLSITL